jgi:hypothetical protein
MDIFKDLGIGIPSGLKPSEKLDLVNIVNGAVANNDTIKTNVITQLNSKLGLSLTMDKGWIDIINAISGAIGVKKWAKGTSTSSATGIAFYDSGNNPTNYYYITVSSLAFKPNTILVFRDSDKIPFCAVTNDIVRSSVGGYPSILYNGKDLIMKPNAYINDNGFQLPVGAPNSSMYWVAYE